MKSLRILVVIVLIMVSGLSSCKKDDNSPENNSTPVDNTPGATITTSSIIQQGSWRVTQYNDGGSDETYHFTGYTFTFNANGTAVAVKSGSSVSGTWNTGTDDGQNKLFLNFGSTSPFEELNDDWQVIEKAADIIRLQDVSGGGGGTDILVFGRNQD